MAEEVKEPSLLGNDVAPAEDEHALGSIAAEEFELESDKEGMFLVEAGGDSCGETSIKVEDEDGATPAMLAAGGAVSAASASPLVDAPGILAQEVQRQSHGAAPPQQVQKQCGACEDPAKGKHNYCGRHRRALECLTRIAFKHVPVKKRQKKGKSSRKQKKTAAQKKRRQKRRAAGAAVSSSTESSTSPSVPDTAESAAFKQIFGYKRVPGDDCLAAKVLCDFVMNFPDFADDGDAGKGRHSTKKRGFVELSSYVHSQGTRQEAREITRRPKLDLEAFCTVMRNKRSWPRERCVNEWNDMKNDSEANVPRDMKGPKDAPLRLALYSWMMAEDAIEQVTTNFEEKQLQTSSKPSKMDDETKDKIRGEFKRGFSKLDLADAGLAKQSLGLGALTGANGPATSVASTFWWGQLAAWRHLLHHVPCPLSKQPLPGCLGWMMQLTRMTRQLPRMERGEGSPSQWLTLLWNVPKRKMISKLNWQPQTKN